MPGSKLQVRCTDPAQRIFDESERELVAWFFFRLEQIYNTKFRSQFSDELTVQAAKREWAGQICQHPRQRLTAKLEILKTQMAGNPKLEWPNIALILAIPVGKSPDGTNAAAYLDYRPLALARKPNRESGRKALAGLKGLFG